MLSGEVYITLKYKFVILVVSFKTLWHVCRNNFSMIKGAGVASVS